MITGKLSDHERGWIIGDFEKSLLRTKEFEVCVRVHPKGEIWPAHLHKIATEYNVLIFGSMRMCGVELVTGDTFIVAPNEIADPIFHEDCTVMCVKAPSLPKDKYLV